MRRAAFLSLLGALSGAGWACTAFTSGDTPATTEAGAAEGDAGNAAPERDAGDAGDATCWTRRFGAPVDVPELSSVARDLSARLSADELTAYVTSERPGGAGGRDIWVNKRDSIGAPFGASAPVTELGTPLVEDHASLAFDGLALYFEHAEPLSADGGGSPDLYVARRASTNGLFGAATLLAGIDTQAGESFPYVAPLGDLYFASDREGPATEYHLFARLRRAGSSSLPSRSRT